MVSNMEGMDAMERVDKFAEWLRQWYSQDEVEAMLFRPWLVREGVKLREATIMGIEEFLHLAASFMASHTLNTSVECVVDAGRAYVLHPPTKTVVAIASFGHSVVEQDKLEQFLAEIEAEALEANGLMALRAVVFGEER